MVAQRHRRRCGHGGTASAAPSGRDARRTTPAWAALWSTALLGLAGCNAIFGLQPTVSVDLDAQYFDAPSDAPFACPPTGETPAFTRLLHQIDLQCTDYSASATSGRSVGWCRSSQLSWIGEGPSDGPYAPIAGLTSTPSTAIGEPRLDPDGAELLVRRSPTMAAIGQVQVYRRGADNQFTVAHDLQSWGPAFGPDIAFGITTRTPVQRMFFLDQGLAVETTVDRATGQLTAIASYDPAADFGLVYFASAPNLSADGLRVVFAASTADGGHVYYSDRPSLDARFRTPVALTNVPFVYDPFLSEDCARIYFSGFDYIFWLQRQ